MDELQKFLEEHPHLKLMQMHLESRMDSVPEEYRLVVLTKHLAWNLKELEIHLKLLQTKLFGNSG